MPTTSPNMGLQVPVVGDAGTGYATNISNALNTVDAHDHTTGKGVKVPAAGLNINADLSFASHRASSLYAVAFSQLANTSTDLTNEAITDVLGQPYWRDNGGVIKKITLAGDALTIANATSVTGALLFTAIAAPSTPAAGIGTVYVDSTSKNLAIKNDAGVVNHGVQTKAAVAHQFLTSIANDGSSVLAQPAFADISGTASLTTQVTGTLPLGNGGTGQTTAGAATDALHQGTFTIAAVNGTTDLSTVSGLYGTVTGSGVFTTTALGTVAAGTVRICTVGAGCTWALTNGASLLTPGAQGLGLNSGDTCIAISQGSGTWRVFPVYSSLYGFTEAAAGTVGVQYSGATPLRVSGSYVGVFGVLNVGASGSAPAAGIYFNANVGSGLFQAATDDLGWSAAGTQQLHVNANGLIHNTRHQLKQGAAVASATTITLGNDGNVFPITGTTVIQTITTTNWQAGSRVTLIFGTGTASQVTNAGNITFRSGTALTTTTNGAWDFIYDGTAWRCQN